MSRSYKKASDYNPMYRDWHSVMRARERVCISQELKNPEYGFVVFPVVFNVSDPWDGDYGTCLKFKHDIRRDTFTEILKILIDFHDCSYHWRNSCRKNFLDNLALLKGKIKRNERERKIWYYYKWILYPEIRDKLIKSYNDSNAIYILEHIPNRVIEKAINWTYRCYSRK
jgi:hypothetical protein